MALFGAGLLRLPASRQPRLTRQPEQPGDGTVVPGPYYDRRGLRCREYSHTISVGGRREIARGTACRNPDGSWTAVS